MGSACMCYRTTWLSIVYEGWPRRPQNRRHLPGEVVHQPEVTIKIIDKETKKVIKELPPEKTLDMIAKVWEMAGILVDEKR